LKIDFSPKLVKNLSSTQEIPADPMKIEIKLFANFREYLPPGSEKYSCWLDLDEGTTVGQALEGLKIPLSIPMIALVNGYTGLSKTASSRETFSASFRRCGRMKRFQIADFRLQIEKGETRCALGVNRVTGLRRTFADSRIRV